MAALGEVPFGRYYGSVDATPLFLMLAAAYHERTGDDDLLRELWPNFERALAWLDGPGDPDGDGFVEYQQRSRDGPAEPGLEGLARLDRARRRLARRADRSRSARCRPTSTRAKLGAGALRCAGSATRHRRGRARGRRASACARASSTRSGVPELGTYALALDGAKRPCRVRTSNAGHALFAGHRHAASTRRWSRETLLSRRSLLGLGRAHARRVGAALQPDVVPQRLGLAARQRADRARPRALRRDARGVNRILSAAFDASRHFDDARLPELLCGFTRVPGRGAHARIRSPARRRRGRPRACSCCCRRCCGLSVDARRRQIRLARPALPSLRRLARDPRARRRRQL